MQAHIYDWGKVTKAFAVAARSLDGLADALARMPRIVITDEVWRALEQSGRLGWSAGYRWQRDLLRMVSYGERRKQRPPRREKRRARKRKLRKR